MTLMKLFININLIIISSIFELLLEEGFINVLLLFYFIDLLNIIIFELNELKLSLYLLKLIMM